MTATFKQLTEFFRELGARDVEHTEGNYLAHVIGVERDLRAWGCTDDVCNAGMFHSIYGTQRFQKFALPIDRRDDVRGLIGDRAERLAYINCVMDRATFDEAVFAESDHVTIRDRMTGEDVELSDADFHDLMRVHLCDWLEQVPRSQEWDYRRAAYRRMAERLGGVALTAFERVYATGDGAR